MPVIRPCGNSPNCVSSTDARPKFSVDALPFKGSAEQTRKELVQLVLGLPRVRLVEDHGTYLHFEFTSRVFRFVDDVEFHLDESRKTIDMRSASRVGRSDLGVNRERLNRISKLWAENRSGS